MPRGKSHKLNGLSPEFNPWIWWLLSAVPAPLDKMEDRDKGISYVSTHSSRNKRPCFRKRKNRWEKTSNS